LPQIAPAAASRITKFCAWLMPEYWANAVESDRKRIRGIGTAFGSLLKLDAGASLLRHTTFSSVAAKGIGRRVMLHLLRKLLAPSHSELLSGSTERQTSFG
jgi:hypothetical protein